MTNVLKNNILDLKKIKLVQKLYIWSLIFEPLLFFINASGGQTTGIPISLSRILQICVIFYFLFIGDELNNNLKFKQKLPFYFPKYFICYFAIAICSSLLGFIIFDSYVFNNFNYEKSIPFFKKPITRVILDLFLLLYYYFYFIVLSRVVFNSQKALNYFLNYFFKVLYLIILLGFLDYILAFFQLDLIPRHIGETTDVGTRWHSILGEPRDAFVFLIYAIFICLIKGYLRSKINNKIIYLLIVSIILTQSFSGILGVFIGLGLLLFFYLFKKKKSAFLTIIIASFIGFLIFKLAPYSDRIMLYVSSYSSVFDILESGVELPYLLAVQASNFYPFWGMYIDFIDFNFYTILFGSGISSSSFYNFNMLGEFLNPNSQITRVVFETGLVGFIFYVLFMISPALKFIKYFSLSKRNKLYLSFFLIMGCSLSHRTLIPFLLYGILLAFLRFKDQFKFS